jgi:integrase
MQRGQIFRRGGSWYLRFYQTEIKEGKTVPRRVCTRLARYSDDFRSKRDVWPLAEEILSPQNTGQLQPESALTFSEFVEKQFLPHIEKKKKPSTLKFYRDVYKNHLRDRVGGVRLRDFTTRHAQDLIDAIPGLSHQSLLRVKTGLSAVFTFARQRDVLRGANPVQGVKAEGRRTNPERYAYSLDEVRQMLSVLPDPARTVVAVAAFTGLRAGEIRGLRWEDFTGGELRVSRSVWRTHVGPTKTEESGQNPVPVIPLLRSILEEHRNGASHDDQGYIFSGERWGTPLHLDNLSRRIIAPKLKGNWHGWHGFRRGLASNLYTLGVPPKVIQNILRHASVETTQTHYIVIESQKMKAAMKAFSRAVGKEWAKNGKRASRKLLKSKAKPR